jgi:hypothetical protein
MTCIDAVVPPLLLGTSAGAGSRGCGGMADRRNPISEACPVKVTHRQACIQILETQSGIGTTLSQTAVFCPEPIDLSGLLWTHSVSGIDISKSLQKEQTPTKPIAPLVLGGSYAVGDGVLAK